MLNFLIPPTDNLYKFIAITGLLFIFASFFYPTILNIKINERILESEKDIEIAKIESAKLEREAGEIELKLNIEQKDVETFKENKNIVSPKQLEAEVSDLEQLRKQTKEATDIAAEQLKKNIEIEYNNKLTKFYNDYFGLASNIALSGEILGFVLMILGFGLWYQKVQKYQDLVLLKEAKENQNSTKTKKRVSKKRLLS